MNAGKSESQFEPLPLKRRALIGVDANQYFVRDSTGESREIKAKTAYEAFAASGLEHAIKIERASSARVEIIEKSKLSDVPEAAQMKESLHDQLLRRKNPILTATELNALMASLQPEPAPQAAPEEAVPVAQEPPAAAVSAVPAAPQEVTAVVPQPEPEPLPLATETAPSPIGMDVHGDGFDEIIPTASVAKPAAAKPQEAAAAPKVAAPAPAPAGELPPERELSAEEVEKLLGGK